MAFDQDKIDALKAKLLSGRSKTKFGDRETQYRSIDEMLKAIQFAENSNSLESTTQNAITTVLTDEGLE